MPLDLKQNFELSFKNKKKQKPRPSQFESPMLNKQESLSTLIVTQRFKRAVDIIWEVGWDKTKPKRQGLKGAF